MAAQFVALGPTRSVVAGTPVPVAIPPELAGRPTCHACLIEALPGNVGKVYIGTTGLNKATLTGVLVVLPTPTANLLGTFSIAVAQAANAIRLTDFWIDADTAGDGVLVSALVA
jgi:hypothetical protein